MGSSAGAEWMQPKSVYFNAVGEAIGTAIAENYVSNSYSLTSALKQ